MNRRILLFFIALVLWNAFISGIFFHPILREKTPEKEFIRFSIGRMLVAFSYICIIWNHQFAKTSLYYPSIGGLVIYAFATLWFLGFLVKGVVDEKVTADFFPYFLFTTDATLVGFSFAIILKLHKNDYFFVNKAFNSCPEPSV
uniref:Uncharacterized protein n=1 Tax=Panagrolaimus davidi TaxID=227884 RepID=A0A914QF61_9BILA